MRQSSANSTVVSTATVVLGSNESYAAVCYTASAGAKKFKVGTYLAGDKVQVLNMNASGDYAAIAHDGYIAYILKSQLK